RRDWLGDWCRWLRLRYGHHRHQRRCLGLRQGGGHTPRLPTQRHRYQSHHMQHEGCPPGRGEWCPHHPAGFFPGLTAMARPDTPASRSWSRISTTVLCNTCPSAFTTTVSCGSAARAALTRWPMSCRVVSCLLRKILPSCVTVRLTFSRTSFCAVAAVGRFTGRPRLMVMESVEIIKNTRRKKITSIMGMISILAFSGILRGTRMLRPPMAQEEFEPRGLFLHALRQLFYLRAEIIVGQQRHNGDEQPGRRGDERLRHPPGDGRRLPEPRCRDNAKGPDHTRDCP